METATKALPEVGDIIKVSFLPETPCRVVSVSGFGEVHVQAPREIAVDRGVSSDRWVESIHQPILYGQSFDDFDCNRTEVMNNHWSLFFEGCLHTLRDEGEPRERKADAEKMLMQVASALDHLGMDFAIEDATTLHVAME